MKSIQKYGVFSGPYFPVFNPNTGKYGPEKAPYLDTFHAVYRIGTFKQDVKNSLMSYTCGCQDSF